MNVRGAQVERRARAAKTIHNLRWFQVTEVRGQIDQGKVGHWQVTMKLGFTLEE